MSGRVRFGLFEFDPETGELSREGRAIRLQPQPARVLAILIGRPGVVVTREHLRQQTWPEGTFVDFDRGLNFSIAQIRSALGDTADSPRFIETLPRRGYRFIAPVQTWAGYTAAAGNPGETTSHADSENGAGSPSRLRLPLWPALVVGVAVVAVAAILTSAGGRSGPVRVAVVPFDNETGQDAFDTVARGVADATVARLASASRIGQLSVIGNSAALTPPRAFRDVKVLGERVAAEYVVLAQMKSDAAGVRLIAHLIRVSDEAHVWANTFDRPAFTLEVQFEIAEAIAEAVFETVTRG